MIFGVFKISGHSMLPTFAPNDRIVISSIPYFFLKPKVGDIIAFEFESKVLVKRIIKESNGKYFIEGDNKEDSLRTGPIEKKEVLGKVIL